jgi:hypothetical protein
LPFPLLRSASKFICFEEAVGETPLGRKWFPLKDSGCEELYILLLHKLKKQSLRKECKNTIASVVGAASPHSQGRTPTA